MMKNEREKYLAMKAEKEGYKKMYFRLFAAVEDAIGLIEEGLPEAARLRLINGEEEGEERYMSFAHEEDEVTGEEDEK